MNQTIGKVIGWLALVAAVTGFFWLGNIMGGLAIVLGLVGYFTKTGVNRMSLTAATMGIVTLIIANIDY